MKSIWSNQNALLMNFGRAFLKPHDMSDYKEVLKKKLSINNTPTLESLAAKFSDGNEIDAARVCSEIVKERSGGQMKKNNNQ